MLRGYFWNIPAETQAWIKPYKISLWNQKCNPNNYGPIRFTTPRLFSACLFSYQWTVDRIFWREDAGYRWPSSWALTHMRWTESICSVLTFQLANSLSYFSHPMKDYWASCPSEQEGHITGIQGDCSEGRNEVHKRSNRCKALTSKNPHNWGFLLTESFYFLMTTVEWRHIVHELWKSVTIVAIPTTTYTAHSTIGQVPRRRLTTLRFISV